MTKKSHKLIVFSLLVSLMLAGCSKSGDPNQQGNEAGTGLPTLDETVGKPPRIYPIETSDEQIVSDNRKHLDGVVESGITEHLHVFIYFNELIPLEELQRYVDEYDLKGEGTIVVVVDKDSDTRAPMKMHMGLPIDISLEEFKQEVDERITTLPPDIRENAGDPTFAFLHVLATPPQLQRMWNEDAKVRMVGLGGKTDNPYILGVWRNSMPWESFR